jgi:membrane protease YdiL (CAAX protease family)
MLAPAAFSIATSGGVLYFPAMLSPKPWKLDAMVRLLLSLLVCIAAGSLLATLLQFLTAGGKAGWKLSALSLGAFGFMGLTIGFVRRPWSLGNVLRRLIYVLLCFYAGFGLAAWAEKVAGLPPATASVGQMIVATLSFQGAVLILVFGLLREHQTSWKEAFGLSVNWRHALLIGLMVACIFLPVGLVLQRISVEVMTRVPRLHLEPQEQLPVQTLRIAATWVDRLVLGLITMALAPLAEELLFRGLLYPWIKQGGFPRLALWGTSLAFAAVHANAMIFLPLLALSLILTILYERTGNLLAPIATHSLFNTLNFAGLYLSDKMFRVLLGGLAVILVSLLLLFELRRTAPEHE